MTDMKKAAPAKESGLENITPGNHSSTSDTAPSKIARLLAHLLAGASIIRFEAEDLGDHCLPSTIAVLANRHGLAFHRQPEKVPNRWGKPCLVTRYSLPTSERDKARKVLALLRKPAKQRREVAAA